MTIKTKTPEDVANDLNEYLVENVIYTHEDNQNWYFTYGHGVDNYLVRKSDGAWFTIMPDGRLDYNFDVF